MHVFQRHPLTFKMCWCLWTSKFWWNLHCNTPTRLSLLMTIKLFCWGNCWKTENEGALPLKPRTRPFWENLGWVGKWTVVHSKSSIWFELQRMWGNISGEDIRKYICIMSEMHCCIGCKRLRTLIYKHSRIQFSRDVLCSEKPSAYFRNITQQNHVLAAKKKRSLRSDQSGKNLVWAKS